MAPPPTKDELAVILRRRFNVNMSDIMTLVSEGKWLAAIGEDIAALSADDEEGRGRIHRTLTKGG